jgi:hypothetical protein
MVSRQAQGKRSFFWWSEIRSFDRGKAQENSLRKTKQGSISRFSFFGDVCYSITQQSLPYPY